MCSTPASFTSCSSSGPAERPQRASSPPHPGPARPCCCPASPGAPLSVPAQRPRHSGVKTLSRHTSIAGGSLAAPPLNVLLHLPSSLHSSCSMPHHVALYGPPHLPVCRTPCCFLVPCPLQYQPSLCSCSLSICTLERLTQHPPQTVLRHLRPSVLWPPRPVDKVPEPVGRAPLSSPSCLSGPLHVAEDLRHFFRPQPLERPLLPPRAMSRRMPQQPDLRTPICLEGSRLWLSGHGAPAAPPGPGSSTGRRLPRACTTRCALFADGDRPSLSVGGGCPPRRARMTRCSLRAAAASSSLTLLPPLPPPCPSPRGSRPSP